MPMEISRQIRVVVSTRSNASSLVEVRASCDPVIISMYIVHTYPLGETMISRRWDAPSQDWFFSRASLVCTQLMQQS